MAEARSILRDYVVKFQVNEPIPAPSTAWVKKIGVVVKPKDNTVQEGIYFISTRSQIAQYSDLTSLQRILDAGTISFYLIVVEDLANIEGLYKEGDFFTMIFSEDFTDQEVGQYYEDPGFGYHKGLFAKTFAFDINVENPWLELLRVRSDFICYASMKNPDTQAINYSNLYFALGNLLQLADLDNRQYIEMPVTDNIVDLGIANTLFEKKVSFSISDLDYSNRLSLFCVGNQPIIAPYIQRLLELDIQAAAISATNLYKPNMTASAVAKVKDYIFRKAIQKYITPDMIPNITLDLSVNDEGWIAKGTITMSSIKALWRYVININVED